MAFWGFWAWGGRLGQKKKQVFREDPELEKQLTEAEALKEEGNEYYKKGDAKSGIDYLSRAIALHPTNKVYYSNRVLMYLKIKDYGKALEDCQKIRELDPVSRYIKGHYVRGLVLYNMKKYKNAASAFQTVIKINPSFKEAIKRLDECKQHIDKEQAVKNEQRKRESEKYINLTNIANRTDVSEDKDKNKDKDDQKIAQHNNKSSRPNEDNEEDVKIQDNENENEEEEEEEDDNHVLKENEKDIENNEEDMTELSKDENIIEV
jgi:tetratricopeptide (TPR) repeat protein